VVVAPGKEGTPQDKVCRMTSPLPTLLAARSGGIPPVQGNAMFMDVAKGWNEKGVWHLLNALDHARLCRRLRLHNQHRATGS